MTADHGITAPSCSTQKKRALLWRALTSLGVAVLMVSEAVAVGLGSMTVHSSLFQPLDMEVEITSTDGYSVRDFSAKIAEPEIFAESGIVRSETLKDLTLTVDNNELNDIVVRITSTKQVKEPFLETIVVLTWPDGVHLREYTLLLDPEVYAPSQIIVDESAPLATLETLPTQVLTEAPLLDAKQNFTTGNTGNSVQVAPGDSLMAIAKRSFGSSVSPQQASWAIYEKNPHAFFGSVHKPKAGSTLVLPTLEEAAQISHSQASIAIEQDYRPRTISDNSNTKPIIQTNPDITGKANASLRNTDQITPTEVLVAGKKANPAASVATTSVAKNIPAGQTAGFTLTEIRTLLQDLRGSLDQLRQTLEIKYEDLNRIGDRVEQMQLSSDVSAIVATQPVDEANAASQEPNASNEATSANPGTSIAETVIDAISQVLSPSSDTAPNETEQAIAEADGLPAASEAAPIKVATETTGAEAIAITAAVAASNGAAVDELYPVEEMDLEATEELEPAEFIDEPVDSYSVDSESVIQNSGPLDWLTDANQSGSFFVSVRDAGLGALALLMLLALTRRIRGRQPNDIELEYDDPHADPEFYDPDYAMEFFHKQLSAEQVHEENLKSELRKDPENQHIRLQLLEAYYQRKATSLFQQTAQEMHKETLGKNAEWHQVVEMGLALDTRMKFYDDEHLPENADDSSNVTHISGSVPGGTSTSSIPLNSLGVDPEFANNPDFSAILDSEDGFDSSLNSTVTAISSSEADLSSYDKKSNDEIDIDLAASASEASSSAQSLAQTPAEELPVQPVAGAPIIEDPELESAAAAAVAAQSSVEEIEFDLPEIVAAANLANEEHADDHVDELTSHNLDIGSLEVYSDAGPDTGLDAGPKADPDILPQTSGINVGELDFSNPHFDPENSTDATGSSTPDLSALSLTDPEPQADEISLESFHAELMDDEYVDEKDIEALANQLTNGIALSTENEAPTESISQDEQNRNSEKASEEDFIFAYLSDDDQRKSANDEVQFDGHQSGETANEHIINAEELDTSALDIGYEELAESAGPAPDEPHSTWEEVEIVLDLAKTYLENDKTDFARELLNDVIEIGDESQQLEARQLLSALNRTELGKRAQGGN